MTLSAVISLIVVLAILGLVLWLLENYVPMAQPFKVIIRFIVILALILYLLTMLGLWSGFQTR